MLAGVLVVEYLARPEKKTYIYTQSPTDNCAKLLNMTIPVTRTQWSETANKLQGTT